MKNLIPLLFLLAISSSIFGQQFLSAVNSVGTSRFTYDATASNAEIKNYNSLSWDVGLAYLIKHQNHLFDIQLILSSINGRLDHKMEATDGSGTNIGFIFNETNVETYYLCIPLYYGYALKKWNFQLGLQTSLFLTGKNFSRTVTPGAFGTPFTFSSSEKLTYKHFNAGPTLLIRFKFSERFYGHTRFYYGLTDVAPDEIWDETVAIRQLSLGLSYTFLTTGNK